MFLADFIIPFLPNGHLYLHSSDRSISNIRGFWLVFFVPCFIEIPVFNANNVDPDQTPRTAASDLGLHFLRLFHLWVNFENPYLLYISMSNTVFFQQMHARGVLWNIWARTQYLLQNCMCPAPFPTPQTNKHLACEDSDQFLHTHRLIRVFAVRLKTFVLLGCPQSFLRRIWSDCAKVQADLNRWWAHMLVGNAVPRLIIHYYCCR